MMHFFDEASFFLSDKLVSWKRNQTTLSVESIRIVLADDHHLVVEGLELLLHRHEGLEVVGVAQSGRQALSLVAKHRPDLLITDLNMPDLDGYHLIEQAIQRLPKLKVIVLSMHHSNGVVKKAMEIGVSGFIHKEQDSSEILRGIHTVMNGETFFQKKSNDRKEEKAEEYHDEFNAVMNLTKRELEVLKHIAQSLTNKEIADQMDISELTVQTHRRNLKKKLQADRTTDLVHIAIQYNLL